eukprot:3928483-Alexandrium_andersonii.AAC.1
MSKAWERRASVAGRNRAPHSGADEARNVRGLGEVLRAAQDRPLQAEGAPPAGTEQLLGDPLGLVHLVSDKPGGLDRDLGH